MVPQWLFERAQRESGFFRLGANTVIKKPSINVGKTDQMTWIEPKFPLEQYWNLPKNKHISCTSGLKKSQIHFGSLIVMLVIQFCCGQLISLTLMSNDAWLWLGKGSCFFLISPCSFTIPLHGQFHSDIPLPFPTPPPPFLKSHSYSVAKSGRRRTEICLYGSCCRSIDFKEIMELWQFILAEGLAYNLRCVIFSLFTHAVHIIFVPSKRLYFEWDRLPYHQAVLSSEVSSIRKENSESLLSTAH